LLILRSLTPTLFPYTTLFRSVGLGRDAEREARVALRLRGVGAHGDVRERGSCRQHEHRRHGGGGERAAVRGRTGVGHGCGPSVGDRKSTRLNSSHVKISYAVF